MNWIDGLEHRCNYLCRCGTFLQTMTLLEAELIANARKPFELNVDSPDDEVLIVTDTAQDEQLWTVLLKAARSMGIEPTVQIIPEMRYTHNEPPKLVQEAMFNSDVAMFITTKPVIHSDACMEAQRRHIKLVGLEEISPTILRGGACSADYDFIYEEGTRLREKWTRGSRYHVTTPLGMDLEGSVEGRNGYFAVGRVEEQPEGIDLYVVSFPDGEASIAPIEGTSNGTIVWDTTLHEVGRIDTPIEATVEDGYLTEIQGGHEADHLREFLESMEHPEAFALGEVAIGINPGAQITGRMREDKKARGYLHFAVGENTDVGGTIDAPTHIDGVVGNATLTIDDELIVKDGEIVA